MPTMRLVCTFVTVACVHRAVPCQPAATAEATRSGPVAAAILEAAFAPTEAETYGHVRFLASAPLGGRSAGSPEGAVAAAYVSAEFAKLGLQPAGPDGTFEQPFERMTLVAKAGSDREYEKRKVTCRNLMAWLPGSETERTGEFILVGAHYDHMGRRGETIYFGADDNASGVAGMLSVARALVEGSIKPRRSVLFAAFDAEERGLVGSETMARKPPRTLHDLVAMINLDMIGRGRLLDRKEMALPKKLIGIPDGPAVGVLGTKQSPPLAAIARAVFAAADLPLYAPEDFGMLGSVIEKQAEGRSDHAPFERRKIPFLFFSTSEHDDYHQPTDTMDKVDPATLHRIAVCVYRTVLAIDALDERPVFVGPDAAGEPAVDGADAKQDDKNKK
ncbi:MAG: M20/M25/M40 family metallo-hydrolase [Planctomycetota bacterium]